MVSLTVLFGIFVVLFAIIGAMRGWAKELLVTSALVLGLFLNAILENYITPYAAALQLQPQLTQSLLRGGILVLLSVFGYQTPNIRALQPKLARERVEEILLGLVLGALNGYLLIGSLFFYDKHEARVRVQDGAEKLFFRRYSGGQLALFLLANGWRGFLDHPPNNLDDFHSINS